MSVDERGPDPTDGVRDELRERQEATRERSDVELWLIAHTVIHTLAGKRQESAYLYKSYRDWADEFTPGRVIDARMWGKEFNRLIKSGQVSGWTGSFKSNSKTYYQFG